MGLIHGLTTLGLESAVEIRDRWLLFNGAAITGVLEIHYCPGVETHTKRWFDPSGNICSASQEVIVRFSRWRRWWRNIKFGFKADRLRILHDINISVGDE